MQLIENTTTLKIYSLPCNPIMLPLLINNESRNLGSKKITWKFGEQISTAIIKTYILPIN